MDSDSDSDSGLKNMNPDSDSTQKVVSSSLDSNPDSNFISTDHTPFSLFFISNEPDSNPDLDSREKGWIRIGNQAKRGGFGFGFMVPGFAHHSFEWTMIIS